VTWVMSNLVLVHLAMVLVSVQDCAWFVPNVPLAQKSFWTHPMELLGNMGPMESHFGPFGIVLVLVQDRSMVCTEHIIGSEIILDAPDGTPR
jgi:hypothetical protein